MTKTRTIPGVLLVAGLLLTGCTDAAGYDLDYIMGKVWFLSTMRHSVSYKAQQLPRLPAPGTVPVAAPGGGEMVPIFAQADLDRVAAGLVNPLGHTPEVVARGEVLFRTHCAVCHGAEGQGNGIVTGPGKFPMGPEIRAGAATTRSDGYIYGMIRVGRGLMPAYGERIGDHDRWAVVHYLRQLQGQAPAVAPVAAASTPSADERAALAPRMSELYAARASSDQAAAPQAQPTTTGQ